MWPRPVTRYWDVYVPRNGALASVRPDPKYQRSFPQRCVVRVWREAAEGKYARFHVHFQDPADEPLAKAVLARAKASNRTLTESEVAQIVREVRS